MGDESEITQIEKVPSEAPPLAKTLNSKCHSNVKARNKDGQENKRQDSKERKKDNESRKIKYSSSSDGSDRDEDSSSED